MLTEIEWWGGLIFIWLAGCYAMMRKHASREELVDYLSFHLSFMMAAFVLALYFYPLYEEVLQYAYLIALCLGVLALSVQFLSMLTEVKDADEGVQEDANEDEDVTGLWLWLSYAILNFPVIMSLTLGGYKAMAIINELG